MRKPNTAAPLAADADVEQLGHAYERTRDQATRRASGAYYTPRTLTEPLVRHALEPLVYHGPREALPRREWLVRPADELLSLRVCDPATGGGAFLVQACRYLSERLMEASACDEKQARRLVAQRCLFGVDRDPQAVTITRLALWRLTQEHGESIESGCATAVSAVRGSTQPTRCVLAFTADSAVAPPGGPSLSAGIVKIEAGGMPAAFLADAIRCGNALTLDWHDTFPGGFDAFLCNPPFGNAIRAMPEETKATLRGRFVGLRGTADLAYYFLALADQLARPDAVTAIVLPRAFLTAAAARDLRRSLLASRPPSLIWCPDDARCFDGANVRVAAVVLGGRRTCEAGTRWPMSEVAVDGDNWWSLASASSAAATVGQRFEVMASMTTAMAYDLLPFLRDEPTGDGLRFVTAGLIDPRSCRWGEARCRYLKRSFAHPRVTIAPGMPAALAKRLDAVRRPKLLVAGVAGPGDRLEAFFDRTGEHCGAVSTLSVFDPADDAARLEALCESLNGDEAARSLRHERGAAAMGSGLLTVSKDFVKGLPMGCRQSD